jgi:AraC-like DNA-binding protein
MDVLGDVLKAIRLNGSVYFNTCFCSPWGMSLANSSRASFHIIVNGEAWLKLPSNPVPIQLYSGDIVLFPTGGAHTISEQADSICLEASQVVEAYNNERPLFVGDTESIALVCGYVEFDRSMSHPFIDNLPEYVHIKADVRKEFYWLDSVIKQIIMESHSAMPGSEAIIDRFTEVLFIQIIRAYAQQNNVDMSYFKALTDKQLSRALQLIHNKPEKEWTVDVLASEIGMSRTAFYNRFNELVGETPIKYLYKWRMMQAKQKLVATQKSINHIAEEVFYQSDSAFHKAFKRFFNFTPASVRKETKK